jgi:PAS domain S-box-containing protein
MKILIADDDADSRTILKKALEYNGHNVIEASNGKDALEFAKQSPPEMIISDILMPGMDGFRLCREVKQDKKLRKVPFIFHTANFLDKKDEELAMNLGASRFIIKPVEVNEFLDIVNDVLKEYKEERLHVPRMPLDDEHELLYMYANSISSKFDEKIRELQLFQSIFTNSSDAIAVMDPEGYYISQNKAHSTLIGLSDSDIKIKKPSVHWGKEVFDKIMDILRNHGVYRGEIVHYSNRGSAIYIDVSAFTVKNEKGDAECYVSITRDISKRKAMEKELRDRVAELETFYETAVSRELKMKDLKEEVRKLKSEINTLNKQCSRKV